MEAVEEQLFVPAAAVSLFSKDIPITTSEKGEREKAVPKNLARGRAG